MVTISKKITTDALQLALILTLLSSGSYYPEDPYYDHDEYLSPTEPEIISEYNSTWGSTYYSQTRAYRNHFPEFDPVSPYLSNKALPPDPIENNLINYYQERILDELRRYSLVRYSSPTPESGKVTLPTLTVGRQNLTAYLVSNTTDNGLGDVNNFINGFTITIPDQIHPDFGTGELEFEGSGSRGTSSFEPLSVISETEPEESVVFLQQSESDALPTSLPQDGEDAMVFDLSLQGIEDEISLNIDDLVLPNQFESVENKSDFDPVLNGGITNTLSNQFGEVQSKPFYNEHEEGAAALPESWMPDTVSFDGNLLFEDLERQNFISSIRQNSGNYYGFDDDSDDNLMNAISPMALHLFEENEQDLLFNTAVRKEFEEASSSSSSSWAGVANDTRMEVDTRKRVISSSAGSISSHDEPATNNDNRIDEVSSVVGSNLDDLWETDSGIFDFLDSPPLLDKDDSKSNSKEDLIENFDGELFEEELGDTIIAPAGEMLQTAPIHPGVRPTSHSAQPRGFQVHRMPGILRSGGMNWGQELANLMSLQSNHGEHNIGIPPTLPHHHFGTHHHPFVHPHHPYHHHSPFSAGPPTPYTPESSRVLLQNATIPPPDLNSSVSYANLGMGPTPNLGSAVASSMHLTNSTDPLSDPGSHYNKMLENPHDMLYYQNSTNNPTTEMNSQGTEGFFSNILNEVNVNDEFSTQLMDMAMNEDMRGGSSGPGELHTNHTYALPPTHPDNPMLNNGRSLRGGSSLKEVKQPKKEHISRDERKARSLGIPMSTDDIINLPMDEFNERLSKYDLSENQLSLIRDIRRRGKNKVAAQNCRKRKLDQILQLADEVQQIKEKKQSLIREQDALRQRQNTLLEKYTQLYRHVFQALRDPNGNPYNPGDWTLQLAAGGNFFLVPRNNEQSQTSDTLDISHSTRGRNKPKDENSKKE